MISFPYMPLFALLLALGIFAGGRACGASAVREEWRVATLEADNAKATADAKTDANNIKKVIQYVDRIQTVERVVPRVVTRLERVCDSAPVKPMPRPGEPVAAPQADAANGQLDQLGAELIDNRLNIEQCRALIAVITPQVTKE